MTPGAVLVGGAAALLAPLRLRQDSLQSMLAVPPPAASSPPAASEATAAPALPDDVRAAWFALRVLGRLPGGVWRNTCLYRAVAACVVLRRRGVAARLRLGVRRDEAGLMAHAWVEDAAGVVIAGERGEHRDLRAGGACADG